MDYCTRVNNKFCMGEHPSSEKGVEFIEAYCPDLFHDFRLHHFPSLKDLERQFEWRCPWGCYYDWVKFDTFADEFNGRYYLKGKWLLLCKNAKMFVNEVIWRLKQPECGQSFYEYRRYC